MIEKVYETINKHKMLDKNDKVLVAVSGGPDSVAMLYALEELAPKFDLKLRVFHLNHQMRGEESRQDARFVEDLAKSHKLPITIHSYDVPSYIKNNKLSVEEGARQVRYEMLDKVSKKVGASKMALGHTQDDQIETFIIRLIKGAGSEGLSGIPVKRGKYIRPLLDVNRDEIERYCEAKGIKYRLDTSNWDTSILRNKVRHELIPTLLDYNPSIAENIVRIMDILKEEQLELEIESRDRYRVLARKEESVVKLPLDQLKKLSPAMLRRLIRQGIETVKGNLRDVEFKHIEEVTRFIKRKSPRLGLDLPGNVMVFDEYTWLVIADKKSLKAPKMNKALISAPGRLDLAEFSIRITAGIENYNGKRNLKGESIAYLDYDKVKLPVSVRLNREGDWFIPLGMRGKKKLQDFFVDEKISQRIRRRTLVVESVGQIAWVVGKRIDERFKVTGETKKMLVLTLDNL